MPHNKTFPCNIWETLELRNYCLSEIHISPGILDFTRQPFQDTGWEERSQSFCGWQAPWIPSGSQQGVPAQGHPCKLPQHGPPLEGESTKGCQSHYESQPSTAPDRGSGLPLPGGRRAGPESSGRSRHKLQPLVLRSWSDGQVLLYGF